MSRERYFEGDHPELVKRLEDHFARVQSGFMECGYSGALVLGGGYGRGEGGVMMVDGRPAFSNDLDYFLFHDSPGDPGLLEWCRRIEREESPLLGIDVEIKCLRADSVGDPSRSMMFADLVAGHVVVAGDADFLTAMRKTLDFSRIEPEEATRLLWNRGSGMFFSKCRMGRDDQLGYVIRNHAKLKLALGDAWLCLHGQYSPRCRERGARLIRMEMPAAFSSLKEWHAEGVEFKFHPFAAGRSWQDLEEESARLIEAWGRVYFAVEEKRLQQRFPSCESYLRHSRLFPSSGTIRNLVLAIRDKLRRGDWLQPRTDYPRSALMRALPCLLGLSPGGLADAGRFLPAPEQDAGKISNWESVYSKWWGFYA